MKNKKEPESHRSTLREISELSVEEKKINNAKPRGYWRRIFKNLRSACFWSRSQCEKRIETAIETCRHPIYLQRATAARVVRNCTISCVVSSWEYIRTIMQSAGVIHTYRCGGQIVLRREAGAMVTFLLRTSFLAQFGRRLKECRHVDGLQPNGATNNGSKTTNLRLNNGEVWWEFHLTSALNLLLTHCKSNMVRFT